MCFWAKKKRAAAKQAARRFAFIHGILPSGCHFNKTIFLVAVKS